jgi:ATP-dependent helicase HrpB
MSPKLSPLPIDEVLPELCKALGNHSNVVLEAPTGAGKTSRVPPALLTLAGIDKTILLIEPRRMAARAATRRMASEAGEKPGERFGYELRFERKVGPKTRVIAITPGVLLRKIQADAFLEDVSAVIFDEFHERSLDNDLSFGLIQLIQESVRPELKMLVMSATLDARKIAAHLNQCPVVVSEGRLYPVDIEYLPPRPKSRLEEAVSLAVDQLIAKCDGDILVFLPGKNDIRKCQDRLRDLKNFAIVPLHGELPAEQQDAALFKGRRRKIVLSTNVAESSVTVEGVTAVIDSGLAKTMSYHNGLGLNRLELGSISRASAEQRSGRAGRLSPGRCVRLWSAHEERSRRAQIEPELLRVDLSQALLTLFSLGEKDLASFPWLDKPREGSLESALNRLQKLNAIREDNSLTDIGLALARLPIEPRLGRLLLEGRKWGQESRVALAAALLSERSPFFNRPQAHEGPSSPSDLLDKVEAIESFQRSRTRHSDCGTINVGATRFLLKSQKQYLRALKQVPGGAAKKHSLDADEALLRSFLAAFPDRVARRRTKKGSRGLMVGGRGVKLGSESRVFESELFLCLDMDAGRQEAIVRQASGVKREWLAKDRIHEDLQLDFDEETERLSARKRVLYDDLVLEESPAPLPRDERLTNALIGLATQRLERVRPEASDPAGRIIARNEYLRTLFPQIDLPILDTDALKKILVWLGPGCRSFEDLRKASWSALLRGQFTNRQWQTLDREAPDSFRIPTGRAVPLIYEGDKVPVLAARIQELFGLKQSPTIASGRVALQVHLLAPNRRPEQITDDLVSFWNNTYPQVRKDLRGRYPRHSWPEDPWTAEAQSRPKRRKRR